MKIKQIKLLYIFAYILIINTVFYRIQIIQYLRAGLLAITILIIFTKDKSIRHSIKGTSFPLVIVFLLLEGYSTIKGRQSIVSFLGSAMVIILSYLLVLTTKQEKKILLIESLCQLSLFYLFINGVYAILAPGGILTVSNEWGWSTGIYLLGQNINLYLLVIIPFVSSIYLEEYRKTRKYLKMTIFVLLIYIFLGLIWLPAKEITFALSCILLLIFSVLCLRKKISIRIPAIPVAIIVVIVFTGVVFSRFVLNSPIVEMILHKNTNLTGRTFIWDNALFMIKKKPVFGYGVGAQVVTYIKGVLVSEHNQILHILIEGGIVSLIGFVIVNVNFFLECTKIKNSKMSNVILISYTAVAVIFLMTAFGLASSWEIFFLFSMADLLKKQEIADISLQKKESRNRCLKIS